MFTKKNPEQRSKFAYYGCPIQVAPSWESRARRRWRLLLTSARFKASMFCLSIAIGVGCTFVIEQLDDTEPMVGFGADAPKLVASR